MIAGEGTVGRPKLVSLRETFHRTALLRCLWKEARAVRPLAIGVFVLAAASALALNWIVTLQYGSRPHNAGTWAAAAYFSAALHIVGAAAALFAGEREERTDRFYHAVAAPPGAVFIAKVLAILLSAGAILAVMLLCATALDVADAYRRFAEVAVSGGGLWILLQALTWGLFAGIVCPQPLLAALLGIALASLGTHLLIQTAAFVRSSSSFYFLDGLWLYAPVMLAMLGIDAWLGVRWALPQSERTWRRRERDFDEARAPRMPEASAIAPRTATTAAAGIGLALIPAVELPIAMARFYGASIPPVPVSLLFIPALMGTFAFRGDHRREAYQFLDQKVARPRLAWAMRQCVWLTSALLLAMTAGFAMFVMAWASDGSFINNFREEVIGWGDGWQDQHGWTLGLLRGQRMLWLLAGHSLGAVLAAYAWGQLCSLVVRPEVLAGFLAVLGSVVVSVLAVVLGIAELSAVQFLGLGTIGLLAISWWLAPQFLAGRTALRDWGKLTLAVGGLGALVLGMIPSARMDQVAAAPQYLYLKATPVEMLAAAQREWPAARETARQYEQVWLGIVPYDEAVAAAGLAEPSPEEAAADQAIAAYARERDPQTYNWTVGGEGGGAVGEFGREGGSFGSDTSLDLSENNPDVAAWRRTLNSAKQQRTNAYLEANQGVIHQALEISGARTCFFEGEQWEHRVDNLSYLICQDAERLIGAGEIEAAWARIVALIRLRAHALQNQPLDREMSFAQSHYRGFYGIPGLISKWSLVAGQTPERLRAAAGELLACETIYPTLTNHYLASYAKSLAVVEGNEPPTWLRDRQGRPRAPSGWREHAIFAAHQLPWEKERARRAAELIAGDEIDFAEGVRLQKITPQELRRAASAWGHGESTAAVWYGRAGDGPYVAQRQLALDRARTCWLVAQEHTSRTGWNSGGLRAYLDAQVCRRGDVILLALVAYRLQFDEYPAALSEAYAEFTPEELAALPVGDTAGKTSVEALSRLLIDPYSWKPFGYIRSLSEGPLYRTEPGGMWTGETQTEGPLLWSVGASNATLTRVDEAPYREVVDRTFRRPRPWKPGYVLGIPDEYDASMMRCSAIEIDLPRFAEEADDEPPAPGEAADGT